MPARDRARQHARGDARLGELRDPLLQLTQPGTQVTPQALDRLVAQLEAKRGTGLHS